MLRLLSRLRDAYRAQGPMLPLAALRWLVRPEYLVIVREYGPDTPTYQARANVRWALLTEADLPALLDLSSSLSESDVRRLWSEGQECQACWIDEALVFYRWDSMGPAYLSFLKRTYLPRPGDVLLSHAYTHPDHRARGLLSASSTVVAPRVRARGAVRVVALVAWWNRPTLHVALDKYRHTVVGSVGYWNLGPWRWYFSTGRVRLPGDGGLLVAEPVGE